MIRKPGDILVNTRTGQTWLYVDNRDGTVCEICLYGTIGKPDKLPWVVSAKKSYAEMSALSDDFVILGNLKDVNWLELAQKYGAIK